MKAIIYITMCLASISAQAQSIERQVIGNTGGISSASSFIVTYTLGEVAVETLTSSAITLTEGYHQGYDTNLISVKEIENITEMTLYPNPTTNNAKLKITATKNSEFTVAIYSFQGKMIESNVLKISSGGQSSVQLNVANQASGLYFVRITKADKAIKTLRLIKQK